VFQVGEANIASNRLLPEDERFQRCHLNSSISSHQEMGFCIDHTCIPIDEICHHVPIEIELGSPEIRRAWLSHPQRVSICQNWTFWTERRQERYHVLKINVCVLAGKRLGHSVNTLTNETFFQHFFTHDFLQRKLAWIHV
jgi:hypothetical protein